MPRNNNISLIWQCDTSDGRVEITKLGRKYQVNRMFDEHMKAPENTLNLTKKKAYDVAADVLMSDVCESD